MSRLVRFAPRYLAGPRPRRPRPGGAGPRQPRLAGRAVEAAREARGPRQVPELPRAGPPGHRGALPRVPQARRRAHQGEERRPPGRRGRLLRLPRRARRGRRRPPPLRDEGVRPQGRDGIRPRRPARAARMQGLPQGAHVPRAVPALCVLSQGRPQRNARRDLPDVPPDERRLQGHPQDLRPREDQVPAHGSALEDAVRELPQDEGQLPDRALRRLRGLPPEPAHPFPRDLYGVPRHGELQDARRGQEVRPREDRLPAEGQARRRRLPGVPRQAGGARDAQVHALRGLPPGRAQGRLPRRRLRRLPHRGRVQAREVRPHRAHEVPPRRQARDGHLRRVSQAGGRPGPRRHAARAADRRVPRREGGLRVLPRGRPQGQARRDLPDLPRDDDLQALRLPAPVAAGILPGSPRGRGVREVPHGRGGGAVRRTRERRRRAGGVAPLQGRPVRLRGLPQGSAPRSGRRGLREVPRPRDEGVQGGRSSRTRPRSSRSRASTRPCPAPSATRRKRERSPRARGRPCG